MASDSAFLHLDSVEGGEGEGEEGEKEGEGGRGKSNGFLTFLFPSIFPIPKFLLTCFFNWEGKAICRALTLSDAAFQVWNPKELGRQAGTQADCP